MSTQTLVKKIKENKEATAYKYFESEIELDDAEALIKALETTGDDATANIVKAFIARYNGDDGEAEIEKAKVPQKTKKQKAKPEPVAKEKTPYKPYHDNSGLGYIDWYADDCGFEFDPLKHVSSRYRVKRGSSNEVRAAYLKKLWHAAIENAVENGDANWFTRIVRHQISALIKGEARNKYLKGIPKPSAYEK
jgi:hypothetical protein